MTQLPISPVPPRTQQPFEQHTALKDVDLDLFLNLMITELQNQDPLNPLENDELLAQISQIREVAATDQLTETLSTVLLGQNIASAISLIGTDIEGLTEQGGNAHGLVTGVSIVDGVPKISFRAGASAGVSPDQGKLESGTYAYRVVWEDPSAGTVGIELGPVEVPEGQDGLAAIDLTRLPATASPKKIYRARIDGGSPGDYYLAAPAVSGSQTNYLDGASAGELSSTRLTAPFTFVSSGVDYTTTLKNIGKITARGGA